MMGYTTVKKAPAHPAPEGRGPQSRRVFLRIVRFSFKNSSSNNGVTEFILLMQQYYSQKGVAWQYVTFS